MVKRSLAVLLFFVLATQAASPPELDWRKAERKVDASFEDLPLAEVLEHIAGATGWEIYVEPGARKRITTRFNNLPDAEALRRLLAGLSFALLPQTGGSAKLFIYQTSLQEATQLVAGKKAEFRKQPRNELIAVLKPGADAAAIAAAVGGKLKDRLPGSNAALFEFPDDAAARKARSELDERDDVIAADYNDTIARPPAPESLALSSPAPRLLSPNVSTDATRIIIGLVDTTVQANGSAVRDFLLPSVAVAPGGREELRGAEPTHGTSMAETILRGVSALAAENQQSTSVRILPVDIYGANAQTTTFDVARGIYSAIEGGATIINLSLGSTASSSFLQTLIEDSSRKGVLFFGAAGNEPGVYPVYPAAYPEVIAVTAGDRQGNIASYANRGSFVDVVAPGANIVHYQNQTFLGVGTSFSTAYVSGVAGAMIAGGKTAAEVEKEIRARLAVKSSGTPTPPIPPALP